MGGNPEMAIEFQARESAKIDEKRHSCFLFVAALDAADPDTANPFTAIPFNLTIALSPAPPAPLTPLFQIRVLLPPSPDTSPPS
jgi:hypothetical protein